MLVRGRPPLDVGPLAHYARWRMIVLHSYIVSPYAAKVRAILRYKGLPFEERTVHPLSGSKELKRISGQIAVPVIEDGGQVVSDSTRIAQFLDEKYPDKAILPRDPKLRARALLLEEWSDEGLIRVVQPVRWMLAGNRDKSTALFRSAYPKGVVNDLLFKGVGRTLASSIRTKYSPRTGGLTRDQIRQRLDEVCAMMNDVMDEGGWLVGASPTVADFAAWGLLNFLPGLDGWDLVEKYPQVVKLVKTLIPPA